MFSFGQFTSTSQFYIYGRKHCTQTGWTEHSKCYETPDILLSPELNLSTKVFMVTGANAGIGREIVRHLASKNATCYMVCRSRSRGSQAQQEIIEETKNNNVHLLVGDCSLEVDVRRIWSEFTAAETTLHCLICNAGALLSEKTVTSEGVEVTLAAHLLFGTYLLGQLAIPLLQTTADSRLLVVSSGGMYNTKFPSWSVVSSTDTKSNYDGQMAYAYVKRGQVLLCEQWAKLYPSLCCVSCHPGWTLTGGVEAAYGANKSYLEPLRTLWQGAEGIIYLAIAPADKIQSGGFYLDRQPQTKHMSGPFFTEGSFTKNSVAEIDEMMTKLQEWSDMNTRPSKEELDILNELTHPLRPMESVTTTTDATTVRAATAARISPEKDGKPSADVTPVLKGLDLVRYMGKWHVLAGIPTSLDKDAINSTEDYQWNDAKNRVDVQFIYCPSTSASSAAPTSIKMHGTIANPPNNTHWKLNPKVFGVFWPMSLDYLIVDLAEDYSYVVVGVPDRSSLYIMTRLRPLNTASFTAETTPKWRQLCIQQSPALVPAHSSSTTSPVIDKPVEPSESLSIESEEQIMAVCLSKVKSLGYDLSAVQRMHWRD